MEFTQNVNHLWLIAGGIMIVLEFMVLPGVGFLFAGLGAITVGALLQAGLIKEDIWQWVIFLASTLLWLLILWKPLKNFKTSRHEQPFSDMVGRKAVLMTNLEPGQTGRARWSGTIMNAKLDESQQTGLIEGAEVVVTEVKGNVLIVK